MTVFPFYENIDGKTFLIIGGGSVAGEKVERIRQFTDRIIVIARETRISGVQVIQRDFESSDLLLGDYVIAATDDRELNRRISELCQDQHRPVNVVDDPALCTFIFPSMIRKGNLTVSISTDGTSPTYARMLRHEIENLLPDDIEHVLARMGEYRKSLPAQITSQKKRADCSREILALLLSDSRASDKDVQDMISRFSDHRQTT